MLLIGRIGAWLRSVLLALERACGWLDGGDLSTSLERTGGVSARDYKECWLLTSLEMTESIGLCSGRR